MIELLPSNSFFVLKWLSFQLLGGQTKSAHHHKKIDHFLFICTPYLCTYYCSIKCWLVYCCDPSSDDDATVAVSKVAVLSARSVLSLCWLCILITTRICHHSPHLCPSLGHLAAVALRSLSVLWLTFSWAGTGTAAGVWHWTSWQQCCEHLAVSTRLFTAKATDRLKLVRTIYDIFTAAATNPGIPLLFCLSHIAT